MPHLVGRQRQEPQARPASRGPSPRRPACVRFLSIEPLLADLGPIDLEGIHWVIVGGESGPGRGRCRRVGPVSPRSVREGEVPFFFKQWGAVRRAKPGVNSTAGPYHGPPGRLDVHILEPCQLLAAIAEIEALFSPAAAADEPTLFASQP